MSAQVAPTIPRRPVRAQQAAAQGANKLPEIPPRPVHKRVERSVSPANFPRSPLNEPYNGGFGKGKWSDASSSEPVPRRPSVQNLPSLGQEGMEYAGITDLQFLPTEPTSPLAADAAAQTRNIGQDLKLYAPKPSLPKFSATAQVQAVTRTDSSQAAAHGIGKPGTPTLQDEQEALGPDRSRSSFSRPTSSVEGDRRPSVVYGEEQGPAETGGIRVPINPLLGDVQAPSPVPTSVSPNHTGTSGEKKRSSHFRTVSEASAPPGSYGLHGHGLPPQHKFEKDWYAKHPEALQHEESHGHGTYELLGSGRGSFTMSSDDLNKIVRDTASRGAGLGTSASTVPFPDEQIGYLASDLYNSRSQMTTPNGLAKTLTNQSQPATESPLRKASLPTEDAALAEIRRGPTSVSGRSDNTVESEAEEPIHIDDPRRHYDEITGGEKTVDETEEIQPYVTHPSEEGVYGVPILAADEVAKEVGGEYLQPAVSPRQDRRGSLYDEYRSGDVTPSSRPESRPTSVFGGAHSTPNTLTRFSSQREERDTTPLEHVDEYEPLFPDNDHHDDKKAAALSHADRFKKRPNALQRRFPSQDIWEDTPSSAMYVATVSTPDLPRQEEQQKATEKEVVRQTEGAFNEEKETLVPKEERLGQSKFGGPLLRDDTTSRPGTVPRFPSHDIWEDSPESHHLVTTVSSPLVEDEAESPTEGSTKSRIPPRPLSKTRLGEGVPSAYIAPGVPPRPPTKKVQGIPPADAKPTETAPPPAQAAGVSAGELRKVPSIPDRPKPQIPPKPAKKTSGEGVLARTISPESAGTHEAEKAAPVVAKVKPQIPTRPGQGSKIANLRGSFMNDLNQKLGLGPPKEKEKEVGSAAEEQQEEERKPLEDARKGRARGPQRRAPAKSPVPTTSTPQFYIITPQSLWSINNDDDVLTVAPHDLAEKPFEEKAPQPSSSIQAPIDTTPENEESKAEIEAKGRSDHAPTPLAAVLVTSPGGEHTDDVFGAPTQVSKSFSHPALTDEEDLTLSKRPTASSTGSGPQLEREELDPNIDAIPASRQTTVSTDASGPPLERVLTTTDTEGDDEDDEDDEDDDDNNKEDDEEVEDEPAEEVRIEHVSTPAAGEAPISRSNAVTPAPGSGVLDPQP